MTLITKFKKDIGILNAAIKNDIFLDIKHPKLYKKICRHYQNEVYLDGEDPERDYFFSPSEAVEYGLIDKVSKK